MAKYLAIKTEFPYSNGFKNSDILRNKEIL